MPAVPCSAACVNSAPCCKKMRYAGAIPVLFTRKAYAFIHPKGSALAQPVLRVQSMRTSCRKKDEGGKER
eukprot:1156761-Pelagomonas_calceolata.AAC.5